MSNFRLETLAWPIELPQQMELFSVVRRRVRRIQCSLIRVTLEFRFDLLRVSGQADGECRALAGSALDCDISTLHTTKTATDRESKAGSSKVSRSRFLSLRKLFEDVIQLSCRNSNARIRDCELNGGWYDFVEDLSLIHI